MRESQANKTCICIWKCSEKTCTATQNRVLVMREEVPAWGWVGRGSVVVSAIEQARARHWSSSAEHMCAQAAAPSAQLAAWDGERQVSRRTEPTGCIKWGVTWQATGLECVQRCKHGSMNKESERARELAEAVARRGEGAGAAKVSGCCKSIGMFLKRGGGLGWEMAMCEPKPNEVKAHKRLRKSRLSCAARF